MPCQPQGGIPTSHKLWPLPYLLKELAQVCPELAISIGRIRDCLGQALYSNYYAAADGTLELRQLPYFTVVERLELEKTNLQQKYEESKKTTAAHEAREHAQELAWQLGEAQRHFSEAQRERDKVKIESEQHLQTVRDAEREAAAAREELKGARKEALRMRNEGNSLRALYDIANVKAAEQSALAEQRTAALKTQLADVVYTLAEMVPMAELQTAKQEADSARDELSELEGRFADMQEEQMRLQQELQAQVHELTAQLKEASVSAAQHLAQVGALLAPEPDPEPVAFETTQKLGCTFAVGLGLGPKAPAFLRWPGKVAMQAYSAPVRPQALA
ncbi:g8290 [Coccomyxa viridis]|uniref:G8290 protein n=1 Tax=Coccomyxa viridis TaxID=1274662 RepID=A0ABP1G2J7_9CHLO